MKNIKRTQLFLGSLVLILGLNLTACKDKIDELSGGAETLKFTHLMAPSPYASAEYIIASENGKYIIITKKNEGITYTHYFSIDGGESFDILTGKYSAISDAAIIDTYISNDGKLIFDYQKDNKFVYELNPAGGFPSSIYAQNAFALTANGEVLSYQYDEQIGQNTYFIWKNGAYTSTGIPNVIDPAIGFVATSGTKAGFLANNKLAEFDVSTMQYSVRDSPSGITLANIDKSKGLQATYSEGYFGYAWLYGVVTISPNNELVRAPYPKEYQFYLQTRGRMYMNKDKVYVQVSAYYGELETYQTTGVHESEMVISDIKFPMVETGESIISQGFIDGGDRLDGGIVLNKNGTQKYLDFSSASTVPKAVFKVGNYLYMNDKRFDIDSKSFHSTGMGAVINIYSDDTHTIAYTTTGTYTSNDDKNWTLKEAEQPRPTLVVKDKDGVFHGLGIQRYNYNPGGTGFIWPQFNQKAYSSSDGINWETTQSTEGLNGGGPSSLLRDGFTGYVSNANPQGNMVITYHFSTDYGVTYDSYIAGSEPEGMQLFDYLTTNGRYVKSHFEYSEGLLYMTICNQDKTDCKEVTIASPFGNASGSIRYTTDDRLLIINGEEGVYITSKI